MRAGTPQTSAPGGSMRDQLARFLGRDRGKTLELRPGAADRRPL